MRNQYFFTAVKEVHFFEKILRIYSFIHIHSFQTSFLNVPDRKPTKRLIFLFRNQLHKTSALTFKSSSIFTKGLSHDHLS